MLLEKKCEGRSPPGGSHISVAQGRGKPLEYPVPFSVPFVRGTFVLKFREDAAKIRCCTDISHSGAKRVQAGLRRKTD